MNFSWLHSVADVFGSDCQVHEQFLQILAVLKDMSVRDH